MQRSSANHQPGLLSCFRSLAMNSYLGLLYSQGEESIVQRTARNRMVKWSPTVSNSCYWSMSLKLGTSASSEFVLWNGFKCLSSHRYCCISSLLSLLCCTVWKLSTRISLCIFICLSFLCFGFSSVAIRWMRLYSCQERCKTAHYFIVWLICLFVLKVCMY